MIFDRPFAFPRYDDDILNAGSNGLLNNILDGRLVYDREHFFGHGFGSRQKACTQTSRGYNSLTDLHDRTPSIIFSHFHSSAKGKWHICFNYSSSGLILAVWLLEKAGLYYEKKPVR
ncbi:hypothetical protein D3C75_935120 [compost metagenome]